MTAVNANEAHVRAIRERSTLVVTAGVDAGPEVGFLEDGEGVVM